MSLKENIKNLISNNKLLSHIREFSNSVFGYNPDQLVEADSAEALKTALAVGINNKEISREEATELIAASKSGSKFGDILSKRVEDDITILPSEKFDYRADDTVRKAEQPVQTKAAKELDNIQRTPGGKERDVRSK